ncbi:MAG: hypothetical protein EA339_01415 [Rhodobacteraceae bacterium]|nr:MAG: hypothetical protein EA339_01415 [Paracoccaceae bacterium]
MVSRDGGQGAETADSFLRKTLELQRQIEKGFQMLSREVKTCTAPSMPLGRRLCWHTRHPRKTTAGRAAGKVGFAFLVQQHDEN